MAGINTAGLDRTNTAAATQLVQPAHDVALTEADIARVLPAHPALVQLLPWPGGIQRGATVAAVGSTSLLLALLSGALTGGSWGAAAGFPDLGMVAAAEAGVPLDRLALVPAPGPDWPTVVATLIDGFDVVAVATPPGAADSAIRALMNRARQKGCVLLPTTPWSGCDLTMTLTGRKWTGLGHGHGRLRGQEITVEAVGRGRAARPRTATLAVCSTGPAELVIPPPAVEPAAADVGGDAWGDVQPNEAPADPWSGLLHSVPPPERRRR
jgi:hypothetical protein